MAEYINKEDALKFLAQQADEAQKDAEDYGGESIIYAECLADVIEDLGRLPAADVAPVQHGKWKKKQHKIYGKSYDIICDLICSCCGCDYALAQYNYCPECGARMDGEEHEGT